MPALPSTLPAHRPVTTQSLGRRLADAALALIATGALFTALAPLPSLLVHLTAWAVFILVLILSAWMDRVRSANPLPAQRLSAEHAITHPGPRKRPDPDTRIPLSLGPFNTQNGCDLDESPESICHSVSFEDSSITADDDSLWAESDFDLFTSFST
ncbi:MAG: hypothetical protein VBE63_29850, partial [Lamprobacter sp.]|uniref:hypothetical protein n=1 Tax=Lamprobacter sp. TaxID=3100796 RepID=UPI002B25B721